MACGRIWVERETNHTYTFHRRVFMKRLVYALGILSLLTVLLGNWSVAAAASPGSGPTPLAKVDRACADAPAGFAHCHALVRTDVVSSPMAPSGYGPSDLRSAYSLTS